MDGKMLDHSRWDHAFVCIECVDCGVDELHVHFTRPRFMPRMFSQGSDGAVPATVRRAKRENGGLGEDTPGSTMTY